MKFKRILKESKLDGYNDMLMKKFNINLDDYVDTLKGGVADAITTEEILEAPIAAIMRGIETEFEHTNNPYEALSIALDHLFESPPYSFKYYDKNVGLPKMEKDLGL